MSATLADVGVVRRPRPTSHPGSYRHFRVRREGDAVVVTLADQKLLSTQLVLELDEELLEFVELTRPHWLIVDFTQVTHSFTSVINTLLRIKTRVATEGGKFQLCNMCDAVREAYRMLNLDGTVFEIHTTLASALTSESPASTLHVGRRVG